MDYLGVSDKIVKIIWIPGSLYSTVVAVYWLYCFLFWYLHCPRHCVREIANGLVLSRTESKTKQILDLKSRLARERAANNNLVMEVSQLRAAVQEAKKELATLQAAKYAAKDTANDELLVAQDTAKKDLLAEKDASEK
jgi:hypothetical protein